MIPPYRPDITQNGGIMDIFREEIDRFVYEQKKMLEDYTNEYCLVCGTGDEHLIRCRNNGKDIYYRAHRENGRYVRKSITNDHEAISALARKEYLRIAIDALKKNIDIRE